MTKAEFLDAIADAPDDANVYVHLGDGLYYTPIVIDFDPENMEIVVEISGDEATD